MTPITRGMVFRVMDGVTTDAMLHLMHQLCNFTRRDELLDWLLSNGMSGEKLLHWFRFEFQHKVFPLVKYVLTTIDRTKKEKIIYGIDWKPE